jgi:hypothetical protein
MSRRFAPLALLLVSVPALAAERHPPLDAAGAREACEGCHPAEAASVVPKAARKAPAAGCFSCHDPHALAVPAAKANPHRPR